MFDSVSQYINLSWVYYGLTGFYILTIVGTILVVISENRNPVKSLAWVTVLLMLPMVGLVLYIFFGRSIKNKRMISRRNRRRLKKREQTPYIPLKDIKVDPLSQQTIILSKSICGSSYHAGNSIKVYSEGKTKFADLLQDLRNARHTINLQYYIIADDEYGRQLSDILIEKARQGVTVRVIYDHVGSFKTARKFFKKMRRAGIEANPFFKVTFPSLATRINWRNHRKIVVIDDSIGYIGGMNIAGRYIDGGKGFESWRDTHTRVTGPIVHALNFSFGVDWNFMGHNLPELLEPRWPELPDNQNLQFSTDKPEDRVNPYAPPSVEVRDIGMQLIVSGPTSQWSNMELMLHKAIAGAKQRIFIQTPYFLPTEGLMKALQTAALSHVDVRIMMPRKSDSMLLTYASSSYVAGCLRSGIKIYFYEKGMMHSKMMIIDDELSTIGSTNFDFRSFEHNFEGNLLLYSKELNRELASMFIHDQSNSERLAWRIWRSRPAARRIAESAVRLLSPIL